jgi:IstB-like ATP binding protein
VPEARDEKRLLRLQRQLAGYKLLIIDELGYVPLSQNGAELLFEVFSQRYERGSTVVNSNLPFDEWTSVFGSERLTGELMDESRGGIEADRQHLLAGRETESETNVRLAGAAVADRDDVLAAGHITPSGRAPTRGSCCGTSR